MKNAILLLSLVAAIFGEVSYDSSRCLYDTSNGVISLNSFGGWINTSLANGQQWFVNPCPRTVYLNSPSPCPGQSGVCVGEADNSVVSRGEFADALFAESASGQGIEIMMHESNCPEGGDYKSTIEFVCVNSVETTWLVDSKGCAVTINILTPAACPVDDVDSEIPFPNYTSATVVHQDHVVLLPAVIVLAVALCSFLFCCCCAARRRRRCQMAKKIQMEQFSNVAFRPIPSNQVTRSVEESAPFNPYVSQPQYFYYYPTQQEQIHESVPLESQDEKIARDLQAQFDQEAQM